MKSNVIMSKILFLALILDLFSAYSFFNYGNFSITFDVITTSIIFLFLLLQFILNKTKFTVIGLAVYLSFIITLLASSFLNLSFGIGVKSLLLYLYFGTYLFLISQTKLEIINIDKKIRIYVYLISFLSFIGIAQFAFQFTNIGYLDFTINGFMKPGFNTTNLVYIGNFSFYRAHSIYSEPSFLSIYSAIGIILLFNLKKKKKITFIKFILCSFLNLFAMIFSIAGSGFLLLILYFLYILFFGKNIKSGNRFMYIFILLIAILIFLIISTTKVGYTLFGSRVFEIFNSNTSGYVRFVLPYYLGFISILRNPFGSGPGNTSYIYDLSNLYLPNFNNSITDVNSMYGKMLVELGIFGFILLILFLIFSLKVSNKNYLNHIFAIILIVLGFLGGYLLDFSTLVFASFIFCKVKSENIFDKQTLCKFNERNI